MGDALELEPLGECPFCGGALMVDLGGGAVGHSMPFCDRFSTLDALSFLIARNAELDRRIHRAWR